MERMDRIWNAQDLLASWWYATTVMLEETYARSIRIVSDRNQPDPALSQPASGPTAWLGALGLRHDFGPECLPVGRDYRLAVPGRLGHHPRALARLALRRAREGRTLSYPSRGLQLLRSPAALAALLVAVPRPGARHRCHLARRSGHGLLRSAGC